ncbi:MAG: Uma2 family endonuclease [Thermomicrobiales bacterium]
MATTRQITIADVERNPPEGNWELIRGEIFPVNPTSYRAARVTARILRLLDAYAETHQLGDVVGPDAGFVIFPDENTLVAPDVGFIASHRVPPAADQEHFARLAPDLVVEVMSPSDRMTDALRKIDLYLEAGVTVVWLVEPGPRTISVFEPDHAPRRLAGDEIIAAERVLPGFQMTVDDLVGPAPAAATLPLT